MASVASYVLLSLETKWYSRKAKTLLCGTEARESQKITLKPLQIQTLTIGDKFGDSQKCLQS